MVVYGLGIYFNVDSERVIVREMETSINNNEAFGAFLIDLPKVSDCLGHDLKIAKLHSHGLSLTSLRLLSDYLSNCKQQIKVENLFSKWEKH